MSRKELASMADPHGTTGRGYHLSNRLAIVFPGQGSQRPGMARDFFDEHEIARDIFARASAATGEDIARLCFEDDPRLDLTEFTQPCILTAEIAMLEVLRAAFGAKPEVFAGHSLGEYTALTAAGVFRFEDALQIVRRRGALMQRAVPEGEGAMAAIKMERLVDEPGWRQLVKGAGAEIANMNSPDQVVMSGRAEAVRAAAEKLEAAYLERGVEVRFLTVSAPFHSSLMRGIEDEFRAYLLKFSENTKTDRAPAVLSNFTGVFHEPDSLVDSLVKQISGPVHWIENMKVLKKMRERDGFDIVEVGPNRPLGAFFRAIEVECNSVINLRSAQKLFPVV